MFRKYELDLEGLNVESTEISFDPVSPTAGDPFGDQASQVYYTNTQPVPRCNTNSSACIA